MGDNSTDEIILERQRDPISPQLFNIMLDTLTLNNNTISHDTKVNVIAFADAWWFWKITPDYVWYT